MKNIRDNSSSISNETLVLDLHFFPPLSLQEGLVDLARRGKFVFLFIIFILIPVIEAGYCHGLVFFI